MIKIEIENNDPRLKYWIFYNKEQAGFMDILTIKPEAEIIDLEIVAKFRRKKLATYLLERAMLDLKAANYEKMFLEVNIENLAAIQLYEKFGFTNFGKRKNYYKNSDGSARDASIYMKEL